jgi:hypothetical protein
MGKKGDGAEVNMALAAAGARQHPVKAAPKYRWNLYHVKLMKTTFITTGQHPPTYAELGKELAELSGYPEQACTGLIRKIAKAEGWQDNRRVYWEELGRRALEKEGNASLRSFERKLHSLGEMALDISMRSLLILEPTSVSEAVLLGKFGMEMVYRSQRQPARLSRFYGDPDQAEGHGQTLEGQFQEASKEDYAATADAVLSKLAPPVGTGPAAAERHDG